MNDRGVMMITGTSRGIGRYLAGYYSAKGFLVVGCSRKAPESIPDGCVHFCTDVSDEKKVWEMFSEVKRRYGRLDVLVNNAGIASMNYALLTSLETARNILETNVIGSFLFCREASRLMQKNHFGRIVNFSTVALPLRLEGEAMYVASKAAIVSLTQVLGREFATFGITVNAVGPTPIATDLIQSVPSQKIQQLVRCQAIQRLGEFRDVANVIDFFIRPESDFVTGQVIYLGGVS